MGALSAYARLEWLHSVLGFPGHGRLLPISDGDARSVSGIRQEISALAVPLLRNTSQSYTPMPQGRREGAVRGAFRFRPCLRGAAARWWPSGRTPLCLLF